MLESKRLALATLFGVLIFVSKIPLVTPLDKASIVVQALLLPLGYLVMGRVGCNICFCGRRATNSYP
jgi:hypothetical protein